MSTRPMYPGCGIGFVLLFGAMICHLETSADSNLAFRLSARNLTTFDPFGGYPDPYVILTYENHPSPPLPIGETSKLVDTQDPDWPDLFNVIYINGSTSQTLTLDVYDEDVDSDDYMGRVVVGLEEIVAAFGGILERDIILNNSTVNGKIIVTANITNTEGFNVC